jgi:hypothetical protein
VIERGQAPEFIRSDNGPEFIAMAVKNWIDSRGFRTLYIEPGEPWQNAYSESFNSRFRDEFLNRELFGSLLEAKVLGREYRRHYNQRRPHSSLDYRTPLEYAAALANQSDGGCAPPKPCAARRGRRSGGNSGPLRPPAAIHTNHTTNPKPEKLS